MSFDLPAYLHRIGLAALPRTAAGLAAVQAAQMRAMAFENTVPFLGGVPDLSPAALWARTVRGGWGGYCFELNGLLGAALAAAGFAPRPVLARVRMGAAEGGARSHLAFVVALGRRRWLVDAGFGGPGSASPLQIAPGEQQDALGARFRLRAEPASGETVLDRWRGGAWFPLYGFDRVPVRPADILAANHVCATAPFSHFPRRLAAARLVPGGRLALSDRRLTRYAGETETSETLPDAAALQAALAGDFGLPVDAAQAARLWQRLEAEEKSGAVP